MESLYLLIPLSVLAVVVAVLVFFWMNKSGQFDDDQGPAWSILLDDDRPVQAPTEAEQKAAEPLEDNPPETLGKVDKHPDDTRPQRR